MSLFLPPVRFRSTATGLPITVHSVAAHSTLADRCTHFLTEHGYSLTALAGEVQAL